MKIPRQYTSLTLFLYLFLFINVDAAAQQPRQIIIPEIDHSFRVAEAERAIRKTAYSYYDPPEKLAEQRKYDVTYYGLDINIDTDPDHRMIFVTVQVDVTSRDNRLDRILLDLMYDMTITGVSGNAESYTHNLRDNTLSVILDRTYVAGEKVSIEITCIGSPRKHGFSSFSWAGLLDGNYLISTLCEPYFGRTWWPSKDIPEDKADSADINITVPDHLTAVSNGVLRETRDNGDGTKTWFWHEKYPITTYLISLAVAPYRYDVEYFQHADGGSMPVEYFVTDESYERAFSENSGFLQTLQMLEVFENLFGEYPFPDEKYAQVEFSWGGGMEHQTATSIGIGPYGPSANLVAHELAHQWWGDMITCKNWEHLWINEGFATYSEGLYLEALYGKPALREYMWFIDVARYEDREFNGRLFRDNVDDPYELFDRTVYDKGAWVLHMLRGVTGDSVFFKILKAFAEAPDLKYGVADTEDFQQVCEEVYGQALEWFFNQWIYGFGRPHYRYSWTSRPDNGNFLVELNIKQTQPEQFKMPLEVFTYGADDTVITTVWNQYFEETGWILVPFEPLHVSIDDSMKVLKWIKQDIVSNIDDTKTIPDEFSLQQNYPNPFNATTSIQYTINSHSNITLSVFSISGTHIATLESGFRAPGSYSVMWDGLSDTGKAVASGMYLCRLQAGSFTASMKMLLLK